MASILVTGLCTLHWGRLQYGNVGNYYIIEPMFRLLHRYFPKYKIVTTFQLDQLFVEKENVEVLPMDLYYEWDPEHDVEFAYKDVEIAEELKNGRQVELTPYLKAVTEVKYVINVSGDMWGDNAEHVGHHRFLVDCLKMKAAQILGKKTILYAVTPGPFSEEETYLLAKEVFEKFDKVFIREEVSRENLIKWGISINNVEWAPCPSFLFEANREYVSEWTKYIDDTHKKGRKVIGMTFGGFNMPIGPYDMWPRDDYQYDVFVALVEYIIKELGANIVLFSHTNGFDLPPQFKLINGRDFVILNQLYSLLIEKNPTYKEFVRIIDEPLLPKNIKAVIGKLDMLLTGRVHASVAATSQYVPTVYMEYERNVIYSDKMTGFSSQLKMEEFVSVPGDLDMLKGRVKKCFDNLEEVRARLQIVIPEIKEKAIEAYKKIERL